MIDNFQRIEEYDDGGGGGGGEEEVDKEKGDLLYLQDQKEYNLVKYHKPVENAVKTNVNFALSNIQLSGTYSFPLFNCKEEDYVIAGFKIYADLSMFIHCPGAGACLVVHWSVHKMKKASLMKNVNLSHLINTDHGELTHSQEVQKNTFASGFECLRAGKPVKLKIKTKIEKQFIPEEDVIVFVVKPSAPHSLKKESIVQELAPAILTIVGHVWNSPIKISV